MHWTTSPGGRAPYLPLLLLLACSATDGADDAAPMDSGLDASGDGAGRPAAGGGGQTAGGDGGQSDAGEPSDGGGRVGDAATGDAATGGDGDGDGDGDPPPVYGFDARPPNATCRIDKFPTWISETGCFDPAAPWVPVAGVVPYTVNQPLWSDGATKRRWFALQDGTQLVADPASGDLDVPVGAVLIKEFSLAGRRVETRFIARTGADQWRTAAYVWAADGSDASLGSGTLDIDGTPWEVPSQGQCSRCHTAGAGFSLGLEHIQLDGPFTYPDSGTTANQVDTLVHVGLLDARIGVPALPALDSAAPLQQRARAYLHVNCGGCHRPSETARYDGRWTTPFAQQGLCNAEAKAGNFGNADNRLILPGAPDQSIVYLRMATLEPNQRMPPLGSRVAHADALAVFDAWISGLGPCP